MGVKMPNRDELFIPLLRIIAKNGGEIRPPQAVAELAVQFQLTQQQLELMRPGNTNRWFYNEVNFTRLSLVRAGFLDKKKYGVWSISQTGTDLLEMCK